MFEEKKEFKLSDYKEPLVASLVISLCLALLFFFPAQNYLQTITVVVFFLFLVPVLYLKIVAEKKLQEFGLNLENKKEGLIWGTAGFLVFILVFSLLYYFTGFKNNYLLPELAIHNFWAFLFYELIMVNFLIFILEFFFCGFIFFSFLKHLSSFTILLQFVLFAIIAILIFGFDWQTLPALAISLNSGIIVYRSRSFIYAYGSALLSFIILDSLIIYHLK